MRPDEWAATTLDEMEATAVTGHTVEVSTTTSVTMIVERASAGKLARSLVLVGQLVMVAAHEVMVWINVVFTVSVVSPPAGTVPLVGAAASSAAEETPVTSGIVADRAVDKTLELLATEAAAATAAGTSELVTRAVEFWRRKCRWRGWEYAAVRVAKRPRATVVAFILTLSCSFLPLDVLVLDLVVSLADPKLAVCLVVFAKTQACFFFEDVKERKSTSQKKRVKIQLETREVKLQTWQVTRKAKGMMLDCVKKAKRRKWKKMRVRRERIKRG